MKRASCAVAALCAAALSRAQDPLETLARAREKLVRMTRTLPNYTCVETIDREYYDPPEQLRPAAQFDLGAVCPAGPAPPRGLLAMTDRLRLEVTIAGGREIHAWPGAREFDLRPIDEIVEGPISTGGFGTYLIEIFDNPGTNIIYSGTNTSNGRTLFAYAFRTPLAASHYRVSKLRRLTAHGGSFEIDAATGELVRLRIETDPTPPETGLCVSRSDIEYQRVEIGSGAVELPRQSAMEMLQPGASVSRAVTTFSGCHEYGAESSIRFDDSADPAAPAPRAGRGADPGAPIRAGIHFTLRTTAPIDLESAAGGDRFQARVAHSSQSKLLPEGAVVEGRITSVRHFRSANRFAITLVLRRITVGSVVRRLAAAPGRPPNAPRLTNGGFKSNGVNVYFPPEELSEVSYTFPAGATAIKPGFEMLWVTIEP